MTTLTTVTRTGLHTEALDHVFTIGASGSSAYTFQGEGLNGTVNNPTLYLTRGKTYRFENGSGGHPIRIQSTSGASGTAYNTGVTNNAGSGTVIVEVQHDAPDVLYYQCTSHAAMNGILYITGALADGGVTEAKIASSAVTTAKLANDAVTADKIADVNVTTAAIAADAVTSSKIAANAVGSSEIQDGNVIAAKLATGAVQTAKIADQAVTLAKLEHGTSSNDGKFLRANNGADPTFETVTLTTINNNADNRVITGSGTANTLEGESAFTFDGAQMRVNTSNNILATFESTDADALIEFKDNNTSDTIVVGAVTGNDLLFRTDAGKMVFSLANNNEKMRLDSSGNLGLGITNTTENTTGDSGPKFITSGDIQIDGDQKALVFRSTSSASQLQSGIQWWNENGAGVQAKIHCERVDTVGADSDLVFYTNANVDTAANNSEGNITEQMRISSAGYVTKPNNPSFRAGRQSSTQSVSANDTIIFNQASGSIKHFNVGNHYSTSTGRFTAPVAGVYHFWCLVIFQNVSDGSNMTDSFDLYVNNTQVAYSSRRAFASSGSTMQSHYFTDWLGCTLKLSANDYVYVRNKHNSQVIHDNDTYSTFQGFLVG